MNSLAAISNWLITFSFRFWLISSLATTSVFGAPATTGVSENAEASKAPQPVVMNEQVLNGFLLTEPAAYYGAENIFANPAMITALSSWMNPMLASSEAFKEPLQVGAAFRSFYLNRMRLDFGGSASFVVNPFTETRRLLNFFKGASQKPTQLSESEIEKLALSSVVERFHLSSETSVNEVLENPELQKEFLLRKNIYEDSEGIGNPSATFQDAVNQMINHINDQRLRNFQTAANLAAEFFPNKITFNAGTGDNKITISLKDLANAKIEFQAMNSSESNNADPTTAWAYRPRNKGLNRAREKGSDWGQKIARMQPLEMWWLTGHNEYWDGISTYDSDFSNWDVNFQVRMTISEGPNSKVFSFSSSTWSGLIRYFKPNFDFSAESTNLRWNASYLAEAYYRDQLFCQVIKTLQYHAKSGPIALDKALDTISNENFGANIRHPTITARILNNEKINSEPGPLQLMKWYGMSRHTNHWVRRDSQAYNNERGSLIFMEDGSSVTDSKPGVQPLTFKQKTIGQARVKLLSTPRAWLYAAKIAISIPVITAVLGTTLFVAGTLMSLIHGDRPSLSVGPTISQLIPDAVAKLFKNNISADFSMNDLTDGSQNNPDFDRAKYAEQAPLVLVSDPNGEAPQFFAYPAGSSFPNNDPTYPTMFRDKTGKRVMATWAESIELEHKPGAFRVGTRKPVDVSYGRFPLPVPTGFGISDFRLKTSNGTELVLGTDYIIIRIRSTGFYFVQLTGYTGGKLSYEMDYSRANKALGEKFILKSQVNRERLRSEINFLQQLGATELSESLLKIYNSNHLITIGELATVFPSSGVYTFDKEEGREGNPNNPYASYAKFLRRQKSSKGNGQSGIFYYQCSGSNGLQGLFFERLLEGSPFKVQQINLLSRGEDYFDKYIGVPPGHRQTVITRTDMEGAIVVIDGTPTAMDPKYSDRHHPTRGKNSKKDRNKRDSHDIDAELPESPRKKPYTLLEAKKLGLDTGDGGPDPIGGAKSKTSNEAQWALGQLDSYTNQSRQAILQLKKLSPSFDTERARTLPGFRLLQINRQLTDLLSGGQDIRTTLYAIGAVHLNVKNGSEAATKYVESELAKDPRPDIFLIRLIQEETESYTEANKRVAAQPKKYMSSQMSYLISPLIQSSFSGIAYLFGNKRFLSAITGADQATVSKMLKEIKEEKEARNSACNTLFKAK